MTFPRARFLLLAPLLLALTACGESAPDSSTASGTESDASPSASAAAWRPDGRPNVLIFLIDTQRADYLGLYGHDRPTSPQLDAFAEESLVFDHAYAPASSTSPSHASLFTSTYPRVHGVWNRVPRGEDEEPIFPALTPGAVTLAEVLLESGYDTAAICDGGNLQENRGFSQGFRVWDSDYVGVENRVARALRWLDEEREQEKPFFLFLHTYQVHTPYLPKAEHVERFADPNYQGPLRAAWEKALAYWTANPGVRGAIRKIQGDFYRPALPKDDELPSPEDRAFLTALYEADIRQTDTAFGELLEQLAARGITPENTLFLVTSDHGEEFWEHGQYGHHQVYDSTVHIPFIARGPGIPAGARRQDPMDLLDIMPTVLYWAGIDGDYAPPSMMGRVLDLGSATGPSGHRAISETNWPEAQLAWREAERKAMLFPDSERAAEVYRYRRDPGEVTDVAAEERSWLEEVRRLQSAWADQAEAWQDEHGLNPGVRDWAKLSPREREALIEMGYVTADEVGGN